MEAARATPAVPLRRTWREVLGGPWPTLGVAFGFAAAVTVGFWQAFRPSGGFYFYNVPIAVPFAAFFCDRLLPRARPGWRGPLCDAAVLVLALARVFAPPWPFVSGHALFVAYAAGTARRRPLRWSAVVVLIQVAYAKLFLGQGAVSLLAALPVAALFIVAHRRAEQSA